MEILVPNKLHISHDDHFLETAVAAAAAARSPPEPVAMIAQAPVDKGSRPLDGTREGTTAVTGPATS